MNAPRAPLVLSQDEKRSPLWVKLMREWEYQLETLRMQNDGDRAESETAKLRGRIAQIKANLSLNNDRPEIE